MKKIFLFLAVLFLASFTPDNEGLQVGSKAVDFALRNIDGSKVSLNDYQDQKGVILIFTCNHCPFSVAYEDRIIALHEKYAEQGFPVVAINSNDASQYPADSYEKMIDRYKEKNFPYVYLHDETQKIAQAYGALKTPHVYLLKKDAELGWKVVYIGAIDDNSDEPEAVKNKYLENALTEVLVGKQVSNSLTKAVGCSIKWKKNK
jgi:peroxiredoxin